MSTTKNYRVTNSAGGTEHTTTDLEDAVLYLLTMSQFAGDVIAEDGEVVDTDGYSVEYDLDDDSPYLVSAEVL